MTPAELAAIEARANAATPGPWKVDEMEMYIHAADGMMVASNRPGRDGWQVRGFGAEKSGKRPPGSQDANAAFIAAARTDIPALVAEVKRLQRDRDIWKARAEITAAGPQPLSEADLAYGRDVVAKRINAEHELLTELLRTWDAGELDIEERLSALFETVRASREPQR